MKWYYIEKVSSETLVISIAAVSSDTPIDLKNKDQVILIPKHKKSKC